MARVLVTESIADTGLSALRKAGHDVDVQLGLTPDDLLMAIPGAAALIVRSATKVTAPVIDAGRGVMVVNAPQSNSLSAAEHTMALLLAQARNVPQAHGALKDGKWERSRWEGVELHGKTLGVLGLGRIGALVAQRAHAFGMRLLAWDPWVAPERARQLGITLAELEQVVAESDFLTIHLQKTPDSVGLIGEELLSRAKSGIRIVNCARGGIVDEAALARAIASGHVGGAALDVFDEEPTTASPLFDLDQVVVTPHLGASTREAQDKAGVTIAEQVALALAGDFVPFAVNVAANEAAEAVRPFVPLAEQLGRMFASLHAGLPPTLEIEVQGGLADFDTRILVLSALKGLMAAATGEQVSYVNAPQLAEERGMQVREAKLAHAQDFVHLVTVRGGDHSISGTLAGPRSEPRIVGVDDHHVEVPPARHMLIVRNDDRVGMVASVTVALADAEIGITNMALGKSPDRPTALMVISTYEPVPPEVLAHMRGLPGIHDVVLVTS